MTCSSTITVGGYPLKVMRQSYSVWPRFKREDRIIRSRRKDQRNPHIQDMPDTALEAQQLEIDFAYSVDADVLRRRLGHAGFTRTSLEQEYLRYYAAICQRSETMFFDRNAETAATRAEAFRSATLDNWLEALGETVRTGASRIRRNTGEASEPENILVDIITGRDVPTSDDLMPNHCLLGFPCSSLDNMAVALLEVTPGDAGCEQEVSMFVEYQNDTTFDDMRLRKKRERYERDI
jgi:HEPN/Toprim N-terminal domain 1